MLPRNLKRLKQKNNSESWIFKQKGSEIFGAFLVLCDSMTDEIDHEIRRLSAGFNLFELTFESLDCKVYRFLKRVGCL